MLELFAPVKLLLEEEPVRVDNLAFRLHCRFTVLVMAVCTILVTAKQYIGEPISCITDTSIDRDSVNAYCWIYGTFTVSRHLQGQPGLGVASPGVGPVSSNDDTYHHRYYQWVGMEEYNTRFTASKCTVCFVLGLQAILFYGPRALWSVWEKGTVAYLAKDLSGPYLQDVPVQERARRLAQFFARSDARARNFYAVRFSVCELLNLLNTVGQIYALDAFLEGEFREYGSSVLNYPKETLRRADPMVRLFPKVAKCTLHTFGSAGSPQVHDALCVLPLNVVNEKIFVFLWFWLMLLLVVGSLALIYRLIVLSQSWARVYVLRAEARSLSRSRADKLVKGLCYGDWFLLHRLSQNTNPIAFGELIDQLAVSLNPKHTV